MSTYQKQITQRINQVSRKASLPAGLRTTPHSAFALQTRQNHGLLNFALLRSLVAPLLQKVAIPLPALKATIVLPAFARSFPADGKKLRSFLRL